MKKSKIAILTSRLPYPLDKGDKLRIYNQLKTLKDHFEVHLFCLHDEISAELDLSFVSYVCTKIYMHELPKGRSRRQVLKSIGGVLPLQVAYFYDKSIVKRISHQLWQLQPDYIHCHLVRMAPYCQDYKGCLKSIDYMDSLVLNDLAGQYLSSGLKQIFKSSERRRIRAYETLIAQKFDNYFVISERDRACFDESIKNEIALLHNGVDLDYFSLEVAENPRYDLVFCGNLGYQPNIDAVNVLLKEIMPKMPKVTLAIAGSDADQRIIFDGSHQVHMLGRLADIRTAYRTAKILVAPIFDGAGQQNKILEAMALGIPCITTSFVNDGLRAQPGKEILLADDITSFVRLIKDLLLQPEKRKELSSNGRTFVETNFNWEHNTMPLVKTIKKALDTNE